MKVERYSPRRWEHRLYSLLARMRPHLHVMQRCEAWLREPPPVLGQSPPSRASKGLHSFMAGSSVSIQYC